MNEQQHREDTENREMHIHRDIGYLIAKVESLDGFIRRHMDTEEERIDKINTSIKRLSLGLLLITLVLVFDAFGIPVGALITKLLGVVL